MAKGYKWQRKELLKEFEETYGFSQEDADSIGRAKNETLVRVLQALKHSQVELSQEEQFKNIEILLAETQAISAFYQAEKDPESRYPFNPVFFTFIWGAMLGVLAWQNALQTTFAYFLGTMFAVFGVISWLAVKRYRRLDAAVALKFMDMETAISEANEVRAAFGVSFNIEGKPFIAKEDVYGRLDWLEKQKRVSGENKKDDE